MSRGKIEPGARCIVVGEFVGYEQNIGAMVTVIEAYEGTNLMDETMVGWTFKDASRGILVAKMPDKYVTDSAPWSPLPGTMVRSTFPARHLLPIGGEDLGEELESAAPRAAEAA